MLKTELLEILANGENSGIEFKRDDIRPEQLAKEIVALVNFRGGRIILGAEDNGEVTGIQRPNLEEWVMNIFANNVHPWIQPFYEEIHLDENHRLAVITIEQGASKPYVRVHNSIHEVFIRMGTTSRTASREQQASLFQSGGLLHAEVLPVPGSSFSHLDEQRLKDYLRNILNEPELPDSDESWIQRLSGLGLMTEGVSQAVCTLAGLLLFGSSPRRLLRQAGVRLMVFDGDDKTYNAILDEALDNPMVGKWEMNQGQRTINEQGFGLIERLLDKMTPFISQDDLAEGGLHRQRQWDYPSNAIREALINAIVHRDWTRPLDIEISIYSDRLEIISPGAMQNSMTVEKMLAGQRSPRNTIIVEIMRDYGYVEARGMGVRTKLVPLMREQNGRDPEFEATDDYLKTVLYRRDTSV